MDIGDKIKNLRKNRGLTQQQFAEKLYISFQSVSNWERRKGHPTTEMMLTIIEKFDLPLDFFITQPTTTNENSEEDLILSTFLKSMSDSWDEAPSFEKLQLMSGVPKQRIKYYFPSYDDLFYAIINKVDQNIKIRVEHSLSTNSDVISVFINDMAPMLYGKKEELHILYTRPYISGIWTQFIKSKYMSLIIEYNPTLNAEGLSIKYLIEMLTTFISVWMSQETTEPLEKFQSRMKKYLAHNSMSLWSD